MNPLLSFKGCACALAFSLTASAQVLMLDFGPTTSTGDDRLNSPYHTVNPGFIDTGWNRIGTADVTSGLVWSTNAAATGLSVNLGATTTDSSRTIGLTATPSGSTLTGSTLTTGIYAGTAPGRDGIFTGTQTSDTRAVGVQIGGLSAGTYIVYMTGRNTNTAAAHTQNFFAGKSTAAGDFDISNTGIFSTRSLSYEAEPTTQEDAWVGTGGLTNYASFSVTLTSGDFLNLAVLGGTGQTRGFLNSIQIVAVPEPSAFAFLAGLATLGAVALRRRRA